MSRNKAREQVFKFVFENLFHAPEDSASFEEYVTNSDVDDLDKDYVRSVFTGIIEKKDELIELISKYTKGYSVDRLYKVDLAILILATYELKYTDTDSSVIINEAVKLCKKYSTDKSYSFCNGVLSSILKDI